MSNDDVRSDWRPARPAAIGALASARELGDLGSTDAITRRQLVRWPLWAKPLVECGLDEAGPARTDRR